MGSVLSVVGKIFSILGTVLGLINIIVFAVLIYAGIVIVPKIKIIMDSMSAYDNLNNKLLNSQRNPPCIDQIDLNLTKQKIELAGKAINDLMKIPFISNFIPKTMTSQMISNMNQLNNIPIC